MPTKGYRTTAERNAARVGMTPIRAGLLGLLACAVEAAPHAGPMSEVAPERPNRMSFGEQVVEAIGEHIDARIAYAEARGGRSSEYANAEGVENTGVRLQALLDKVRFAL